MLDQVAKPLVLEAHCISEWGHNFRPDYLKLARFAQLCKAERTLALTATAPPAVLDDICREFAIDPECAIRTGFYRANLTLLAAAVSADGARVLVTLMHALRRLGKKRGVASLCLGGGNAVAMVIEAG